MLSIDWTLFKPQWLIYKEWYNGIDMVAWCAEFGGE